MIWRCDLTPQYEEHKEAIHEAISRVLASGRYINGENVDGWMAAMTMIYPVDNADVFKTAKVGDTIEATVYQDDYTLYNVRLVTAKK